MVIDLLKSDDVLEQLRTLRLLESVPDQILRKLSDIGVVERASANSTLFSEGARCDRMFFVIDGMIALDMNVPRREPTRILTIGPGEVLAWSAVVGDQRMTATATALEETRLVAIDASTLSQLCERDHQIGYALMKCLASALSRRLLATRLQLLDLFAQPESN
jgi:CRP/FNR family cyclic AMP-dependent transcriptional regulator